jgi:hypothetical protein
MKSFYIHSLSVTFKREGDAVTINEHGRSTSFATPEIARQYAEALLRIANSEIDREETLAMESWHS